MDGIAIYERDELMRELLREWLSAAGYTVRDVTTNGAANAPELAIVSVETPPLESAAVIRWVRRSYPKTPVIALSGWARSGLSSNGSAARTLGVERLVAKPLLRHELLMAVDSVIGPPPSN